jgi:phosphatidylserine decarboxylase
MKQKTRDGRLYEGADGQDRLLGALYGNAFGRMLLKPLTAPWLSKAAGAFLSTKASCIFIKPFIKSNRIDMSQFEPVEYESYNDFFSRRIREGARPVDMDLKHLVSPADSKLTALPITQNGRFTLKHTEYTVGSLLKNPALAAEYVGGWALIFRLTVDDYHRYCYAFDGEKGENVAIPGKLHTVNPIANDFFPIYKENAREYTILRTEHFGEVIAMEVGALLVGKIVNHHGAAAVRRGQEKGYFQFGGSTVVLLLKQDATLLDDDILENSRNGIETVVKFGEKIGIAR